VVEPQDCGTCEARAYQQSAGPQNVRLVELRGIARIVGEGTPEHPGLGSHEAFIGSDVKTMCRGQDGYLCAPTAATHGLQRPFAPQPGLPPFPNPFLFKNRDRGSQVVTAPERGPAPPDAGRGPDAGSRGPQPSCARSCRTERTKQASKPLSCHESALTQAAAKQAANRQETGIEQAGSSSSRLQLRYVQQAAGAGIEAATLHGWSCLT
jgi:hypothetical protein